MMRILLALLALVLPVCPAAAAWPNGYSYRRQVVINHSGVAGDLTGYPLLIAGTYSDLATVANGGKLNSLNGYDLVAASDVNGANLLKFQRVSWSSTTGAIVLMVNLPALSSTVNTNIYLFYGNASIVADPQNAAAVWDSSYSGVFHLADNANNNIVADSTGNANNGINVAVTSSKSVAGPFQSGTLGAGLSYNGSTDSTDLGVSADWDVTTGDATWELWVLPTTLATFTTFLSHGAYGADGYYFQWSNQAAQPGAAAIVNGVIGFTVVSPSLSFTAGVWSHIAFVKSGTMGTWFVNGAPSLSTYVGTFASAARHLWLGRYDAPGGGAAVELSEFRYSSAARSAAWIATNFNNQSNPSGFYTIGAPTQSGGIGASSFIVF